MSIHFERLASLDVAVSLNVISFIALKIPAQCARRDARVMTPLSRLRYKVHVAKRTCQIDADSDKRPITQSRNR